MQPQIPVDAVKEQNLAELAKVEPLPNMTHILTLILNKDNDTGKFYMWLEHESNSGQWIELPDSYASQIPMMITMMSQKLAENGQ